MTTDNTFSFHIEPMQGAERIQLLRDAQTAITDAITQITRAVQGTEAEDWATVYTLLWLHKVVDRTNLLADIGNLDDLMAHLAAGESTTPMLDDDDGPRGS
jgi:hypothetical protein